MKKTLKKALILMAVVITAMLVMTFVSSAAVTDCGDANHVSGERVVDPTCVEGGYTETYCTVCGKVFGTSDHVPALGHDYENGTWEYVHKTTHYVHTSTCKNGCGTTYDEEVGGNVVKYYKVILKNPWVMDKADETVTYTTLADTYKEEIIKDDKGSKGVNCEWFVEADTTIADYVKENYGLEYGYDTEAEKSNSWLWYVINKNLISRVKDKTFGRYDFAGWTLTANNENATSFFDVEATQIDQSINGQSDIVLYAAFTGDSEVYYTVQYYDVYGIPSTRGFKVRHGEHADDSIFEPDENGVYKNAPQKIEDSQFYYEFKGWDKDISHIYADTSFYATFTPYIKSYIYVYCDENGVPLRDAEGNVYKDVLDFGATSVDYPKSELDKVLAKEKDRTYIYFWSGKWVRKDSVVEYDHSCMTPNIGDKDSRYGDEATIYLIPKYTQKLVVYTITLTISLPQTETDYDRYLDDIIVQVTDSYGQLVKSGKATRSGNKAVFTCTANDSQYYNITAVTGNEKYSCNYTIDRQFVYDVDVATIRQDLQLTLNQDYVDANTCKCICHSPFRAVWARILNLLYRFFKVKYVCCYDMYATLGDVLIYTK